MKKIVSLVEQLVLVVFSFVMTKAGVALVTKQMQTGQTTPVLKIPMAFMYASLVLAFGIILIVQVGILIEKVMALKKKEAEE